MSAPRWTQALLRRLAPADRRDDVLGDLEEAHRRRVEQRGSVIASVLTAMEALDMAAAVLRERGRRTRVTTAAMADSSIAGGRRSLGVSWLDFKLGFRMLGKYPGLTVVGGLAFAFAIAIGAAVFQLLIPFLNPTLPFDEGDRIVAIRNWDAAAGRPGTQWAHDLARWRAELDAVDDIGAYRAVERNLVVGDGPGEPVRLAEISASAFRVTRVPPALGRTLTDADEQAGAPPVVVIGHDVWQSRFGGDARVVGSTVRLGNVPTTVVGVMPADYAFPFAPGFWTPLRLSENDDAPGEGPGVRVFARLAPGFTLEQAQAEVSAIGVRAAADLRETHEHLRPEVVPYAQSVLNLSGWESVGIASGNFLLVLALVLIWGNVALLMFARAATRESEIIVRNALGATRGRIIMQLFAEALVLGGVAAVGGLVAAQIGLGRIAGVMQTLDGELPFWFSDRLSMTTMIYAALLTLVGAAIAGILPALKVTGRGAETRLRQSAAGGPGIQFGGVWTVVIILQVAVTVAFPVEAFFAQREVMGVQSTDVGFPSQEYLSVRLDPEREGPHDASAARARFQATTEELERRLSVESRVAGVTFASVLPGMIHPRREIEVDGAGLAADSATGGLSGSASVARDFFETLGAPILAGRSFATSDAGSDARVVIVNRSFVREVLGGRSPIGQRVRYAADGDDAPGPWHEIVGVVGDLGMTWGYNTEGSTSPGLYHPLAAGAYPVYMAVHIEGEPEAFAVRIRAVAGAVDPTLRLYDVMPLDGVTEGVQRWLRFLFWLTVGASSLALLLSLAGIYSVMAFTVSRRTREIGIRVALGADHRRIVAAVFRRPLTQVALGLSFGMLLAAGLASIESRADASMGTAGLLLAYMALMLGVCMLACIVPTRRALRVEPTEALRSDA